MKKNIEEYEGDLWVVLNQDGTAKDLLFSKPTLGEMQEAIGGYIEYAPVKEGAKMPIPINRGLSRVATVKDIIVDEDGLLKGYQENAVSTYAMTNIPINEQDNGTPILVGPAIIHVEVSQDDKLLDFKDFMALVSGQEGLHFASYGIQHMWGTTQ